MHITRLAPDGLGKAGTDTDKIMVGLSACSPIVLAPPNDLLGLAITEGIEDALSAHIATGLGAWAAGAASFLPALAAAIPAYVECITILADNDPDGTPRGRARPPTETAIPSGAPCAPCSARSGNKECGSMKTPDANDILRHGGKAELRAAIDSGADVIDLPENLAAELANCRRLVAATRKDKIGALHRGAVRVFHIVTQDTPELFDSAVNDLYAIANTNGMTDDNATQKILDAAIIDAAKVESSTPSDANGHDAAPLPSSDHDRAAAADNLTAAVGKSAVSGHDAAPIPNPEDYGINATFDRSNETRQQIAAAATETTGRAIVAFPAVAFGDIKLDRSATGYLVKGLLSSTGLAVVWGPPKCGKSFWVMDLALHVAKGWPYRGKRVRQAPVIYFVLEGRSALPKRVEAMKRHYGITEVPLFSSPNS